MLINAKAASFIKALAASRAQGFNDFAILTHAWHESGGFARVIGQFNAWGIKVPQRTPWPGPVCLVPTTEYTKALAGETPATALPRLVRNDVQVLGQVRGMWKLGLKQAFIDFNDQPAALKWYCDFIRRLYPLSFAARGVPSAYFYGLVGKWPVTKYKDGNPYSVMEYKPGALVYATDPDYVDELLGRANALQNDASIKAALAATA